MTTSDSITHYYEQDLPESGPCPNGCGQEAKYRERDHQTEDYMVTCPVCGKYLCTIDALEELLDRAK
jgi:hypothetical protein